MEVERQFIDEIRQLILHVDNIKCTVKYKLELLSFSILVMLDGLSGSFDYSIEDLQNGEVMLHELFHKKKTEWNDK